jgi:hypothetical protein
LPFGGQPEAQLARLVVILQLGRRGKPVRKTSEKLSALTQSASSSSSVLIGSFSLSSMRRWAAAMTSMPRMSSSGQRVFIESENSAIVWSTLAHLARHFVIDDLQEAFAQLGFHVRIIDQVGHCRPDIAERGPAAFGQRMQDLVAAGFLLDAARDVLDRQHVAGHRASPLLARSQYRNHLDAQQLAAAWVVMKFDIAVLPAARRWRMTSWACWTWFFSRIENIERPRPISAPAGDRGRPLRQRLELQAGAVVVEQDAAVEIAHDHCLGQFRHQRRQAVFLFLDGRLGLAIWASTSSISASRCCARSLAARASC